MSVSLNERTNLIKLAVAMFNVAPGATYLAEITGLYEANGRSLGNVAAILSNTPAYKALNPVFQTAGEFATAFLTPLGLQANNEARDYIVAKFNAYGTGTVNKGQISLDAAAALVNYTGADASLLAAKATLENKTAVATYYSVDKLIASTDLAALKAVLVGVTDDIATVATAKAAVDGTATAGQIFTLTTGVDTLVGGAGNDTFNASSVSTTSGNKLTLTALDSIDGGAGINTLNVTDTVGNVDLSLETITNIQKLVVTSIGGFSSNAVNVTGITGLTNATFALRAAAAETVTASDTTAVNVTNTLGGATVVGGSTINVTAFVASPALVIAAATAAALAAATTAGQTAATASANTSATSVAAAFAGTTGVSAADIAAVNAASTASGSSRTTVLTAIANVVTAENNASTAAAAAVAVNAVTATTNAALTSATIVGGLTVTIADASAASNTLTTVSLSGNSGAATLTGSALTNVSIAKTSAATTIVNAAVGGHTQTIGVNAVTGAAVITDTTATSVILNVTGAKATTASSINLTTAAATAITVNNAAALTLVSTDAVLKTLTVTGAGTLTADVSGNAALTLVDASASTGANNITLSNTEAFTGGSGVSTVTVSAAPTLAITGGAGTADVIIENSATDILTGNTKVTGFETLGLGTQTTGSYDATGFAHLSVANNTASDVTFAKVAAGVDLTLTGGSNNIVTYTLLNSTGAADAMTLNLKGGVSATSSVSMSGIETVNVVTSDTNTTAGHIAVVDTLNLTATGIKSIVATGTAGLILVDTDTSLTSVNASDVVGGFTLVTGALVAGATGSANYTFVGSTAGGDTINASASKQGVTITETAGINIITGSSSKANTLTGGTGADTIVGGSGKDVIVGGGGADVITGGAGADLITLSGSTSKIVQASGDSGANTSTTVQVSELTSTFDVIKGVVAGDKIDLSGLAVGYVTANLVLAGANLAAADNAVVFTAGTYDSAAGTFTFAANGVDTAVTYDHDTTGGSIAGETIILVGFHAGATTTAAGGVITLA